MKNESNKTLLIILIVLVVCLLGLGGYILHELNQTKTNQQSNNNTQNNEVNSTSTNISISDVAKYFTSEKDSKLENITPKITNNIQNKDFKNLDMSSGNTKIIADCTKYSETEDTNQGIVKGCNNYTVKINDSIVYNDTTVTGYGCESGVEVLRYNNNIIVETLNNSCIENYSLKVYNTNNKMVYSTDGVFAYIYNGADTYSVQPIVNNGKLYFVEETVINPNYVPSRTMKLVSIDLTNYEVKTVSTFEATHGSNE